MNYITNNIIKKVVSNIETNNLLNRDDTIIVGVSGGADSTVLLHILYTISNNYNYNFHIKVAHVNHQIRKETAKRDELFVQNMCEKMNIPFYCRSIDVELYGKENGLSCEEAGRKIRYNFFKELAGENGKIATAHNADDNAETVLMRFIRGTGLKGLCGIKFQNKNIIRPLLNVSRKEIEQYARENGLDYVTDETNLQTVYTRNKLRLNLIPQIETELNPNFKKTLNNNIQVYNTDMDFIEKEAEKTYEEICTEEKDSVNIDYQKFMKVHPAIQNRILLTAISFIKTGTRYSQDICSTIIASVYDVIAKNEYTPTEIIKDVFVSRTRENTIHFYKTVTRNIPEFKYNIKDYVNCSIVIGKDYYTVKIVQENNIINNADVIFVPITYLDTLQFRNRKQGDVFVKETNMKVKLGKHLTNMKIPTEMKNSIPMLCSENKVFWIPGYSATRFEERNGIFIRIKKENVR